MKQKINFSIFISLIFFNNFFAMDIRLLLNSQPIEENSDQNKIVIQLNNLQHKKIIQPRKNKKLFCSDCNQYFNHNYFYIHCRMHTQEGLVNCKYCNTKFVNNTQLIIHTRIHTNERPFKCNQCDKKFIQYSHLYNHKKMHEGKKNYHCLVCNKSFLIKSTLKIHEQSKRHKLNFTNFKKI